MILDALRAWWSPRLHSERDKETASHILHIEIRMRLIEAALASFLRHEGSREMAETFRAINARAAAMREQGPAHLRAVIEGEAARFMDVLASPPPPHLDEDAPDPTRGASPTRSLNE